MLGGPRVAWRRSCRESLRPAESVAGASLVDAAKQTLRQTWKGASYSPGRPTDSERGALGQRDDHEGCLETSNLWSGRGGRVLSHELVDARETFGGLSRSTAMSGPCLSREKTSIFRSMAARLFNVEQSAWSHRSTTIGPSDDDSVNVSALRERGDGRGPRGRLARGLPAVPAVHARRLPHGAVSPRAPTHRDTRASRPAAIVGGRSASGLRQSRQDAKHAYLGALARAGETAP